MGSYMLIAFSVFGSLASVVGLLKSEKKSHIIAIHIFYGVFIIILSGLWVSSQVRLEDLIRIENQAKDVIQSGANLPSSGAQRGFIFAGIAFLEKNKDRFPETFKRTLILYDNVGITQGRPSSLVERGNQDYRLEDGAEAMRHLLRGIAAGK